MNIINQDITSVDVGIVAHGVNCQRVMGSGVALAIRKAWPIAFEQYVHNEPVLGSTQFVQIDDLLWVANCYTQTSYGRTGGPYADLDSVRSSLSAAFVFATEKHLPLFLPRIGCGLGGLKWDDVRDVIEELEEKFPHVDVTICDI